MKIAILNAALYTGEESFANGQVQIENDRIIYAGDAKTAPAFAPDRKIDAKGGIVMPGLVNAHAHTAMTLTRGVGSDLPLMDWLGRIWPIEDRMTGEQVYWGNMLGAMELIRGGTTAVADMYMLASGVSQSFIDAGLRANVCRCLVTDKRLPEAEALYKEYNGAANGRVRISFGPHACYTTTPELLKRCVQLTGKYDTEIHIHNSETKTEIENCQKERGRTPVEYFHSLGILDQRCIFAHNVYLSDHDIELMARENVTAVHCPVSNLKLASGIAPINEYQKRGVQVAIGTDGCSSSNTQNMFAELRVASILQKGITFDSTVLPVRESIKMATINGAKALGFEKTGLLKAGWKADLLVLHANDDNLMPLNDIPTFICYSAESRNLRISMVDGNILFEDGEYKLFDAERVKYEFTRCVKKLMNI